MAMLIDVARIGRDAELRYTPGENAQAVVNLALAMDYGRKDPGANKRPTQWVDAALWGRQAEALAEYLVKGQQVLVHVYDVHIEEYTSQGVTRPKLVGTVKLIKLVGSAPQAQQTGAQQAQSTQQRPQQQAPQQAAAQQSAPGGHDAWDDLDIPF